MLSKFPCCVTSRQPLRLFNLSLSPHSWGMHVGQLFICFVVYHFVVVYHCLIGSVDASSSLSSSLETNDAAVGNILMRRRKRRTNSGVVASFLDCAMLPCQQQRQHHRYHQVRRMNDYFTAAILREATGNTEFSKGRQKFVS